MILSVAGRTNRQQCCRRTPARGNMLPSGNTTGL